jgi:uroporphyrinogen decarboxylase
MDPALRDVAVRVGSAAVAGLVVYKLFAGPRTPVDTYRPVIDPVAAAAAETERATFPKTWDGELTPTNDTMVRAAKGQPTDFVPVWVMRQAGRYLPEFRAERLKSDFFSLCRTPTLACEVTLQPLRRFDLDGSIIFSDILVIPQALGMEVLMLKGKGPSFPTPLVTPDDLKRLTPNPDVDQELGYVFQAIALTKKSMDNKLPIFGFCGGPWTVMSYMIEGGGSKNFSKAKGWIFKYPEASHQLLKMLTDTSVIYLVKQVQAGANFLQIFESWAGELSPYTFAEFLLPYAKRIATEVKAELRKLGIEPVPMVIFCKGAHYALEDLAKTDYDVIQVDWTIDPTEARRRIGPHKTVQGNMDPCVLYGSDDTIRKEVERVITGFGTQKYIANLGHGMHPTHKPEKLKVFIDAVHDVSRRLNAA